MGNGASMGYRTAPVKTPALPDLPINEALLALHQALLEHHSVLIEAPPGAGKSTIVPIALLPSPWLKGQKILMLEPRRIAARGGHAHVRAVGGTRRPHRGISHPVGNPRQRRNPHRGGHGGNTHAPAAGGFRSLGVRLHHLR